MPKDIAEGTDPPEETLELSWWHPLVATVAVWCLSLLIFAPVRGSLRLIREAIPALPADDAIARYLLSDTAARLSWIALMILLSAALAAAITHCWRSICLSSGRLTKATSRGLKIWGIALALFATCVVAAVRFSTPPDFMPSLDPYVQQMAVIEKHIDATRHETACSWSATQLIGNLTLVVNFATVAFIVLLAVTFATTLATQRAEEQSNLSHLAEQQRRLSFLLYLSAILLIVGVLEIYAVWSWPSVIFTDKGLAQGVDKVARAIAVTFGAFFTMTLACLYIPSAMQIGEHARQLVEEQLVEKQLRVAATRKKEHPPEPDAGEPTPADVKKELAANGFASSLADYLNAIGAILGPLLAAFMSGPVGDLLAKL